MKLEDLSPELQEKAKACTSAEELLELARTEGVELTDDQLEVISGGSGDEWYSLCDDNEGNCPKYKYRI